jgi:3-deoxy-D-manno-octulosonate 8-phosphate phosphatase (KDO 8-P phosphatase)
MFERLSERLIERAKKIKIIGFDVDGVLTDGSLYFGDEGEIIKRFYALDGHGFRLAASYDLQVAVISARESKQAIKRCQDLGLSEIHTGIKDKLACVKDILARNNYVLEEMAFIGDDSIDVPVLECVGLAACPKNSHYSVLKHIHYITEREGGHGAAREFIDLILFCQSKIPSS